MYLAGRISVCKYQAANEYAFHILNNTFAQKSDMANRLEKIVLWFLGALFFIVLAVIIATMNRGFDFEDESFYLLCYKYPHIYTESVSTYHVIIDVMNAWLNPGIITYRVESLFFKLQSSWVLWEGLKKWVAVFFACVAQVSTCCYICILSRRKFSITLINVTELQ